MNHIETSQLQQMTSMESLQFQQQQQLQFNQQQTQQFQPNQDMTSVQQNYLQIPGTATSSVFQTRPSFNSNERKTEIEAATKAGEQFYKLYYDTLQKRRHIISKMYLDNAVIIWNGHGVASMPEIQKLFEELPSGVYNIYSVDAQPLSQEAAGTMKTIVVTVAGVWRLPHQTPLPFQQIFVITTQGDKWKIASDVFRTQETETS